MLATLTAGDWALLIPLIGAQVVTIAVSIVSAVRATQAKEVVTNGHMAMASLVGDLKRQLTEAGLVIQPQQPSPPSASGEPKLPNGV